MRGYSLLEIIIVITIAGVLLAISVMAYSTFLDRQRLNKAAEEVVTIIQKARAMTVSSYGGTAGQQYCVRLNDFDDPAPNKLIIKDATFADIESYTVSEGVIVASFVFNPSPVDNNEICFKRLSGDAFVNVGGTPGSLVSPLSVKLKSQSSGKERTVTVSSTGVVQAQ